MVLFYAPAPFGYLSLCWQVAFMVLMHPKSLPGGPHFSISLCSGATNEMPHAGKHISRKCRHNPSNRSSIAMVHSKIHHRFQASKHQEAKDTSHTTHQARTPVNKRQ